jgi:hypothetical protein
MEPLLLLPLLMYGLPRRPIDQELAERLKRKPPEPAIIQAKQKRKKA